MQNLRATITAMISKGICLLTIWGMALFVMFRLMRLAMLKVLTSLLMTHKTLSRLPKVLMAHYITVLSSGIEWVAGN